MAMGKRQRQTKQRSMWIATHDLPRSGAHPFYTRLKRIGGYTVGTKTFDALIVGYYEDDRLMYAARERQNGQRYS